jgi:tRNA(Ile2) C34 agmatinyltransferase TiaS
MWLTEIISTEWKEPPVSYRRHLAKPLSRMGKSEGQ